MANNENDRLASVPPVQVIPVVFEDDLFEPFRVQIQKILKKSHPKLSESLENSRSAEFPLPPIDAFMALPQNTVIEFISSKEKLFVPGPKDMFSPSSLIPIALSVGLGSGGWGCTVGSKTKYRRY